MARVWFLRLTALGAFASGAVFAVACGNSMPPSGAPDASQTCFNDRVERRYLPVTCGPTCTAHATEIRRCVAGRWNVERKEADCAPCPSALTPALADCSLEGATLKPSELSALDGCTVRLHCGGSLLETSCDGENDGTNTSLCECTRDLARDEHVLKNPYSGEAPDSCLAAVADCRTPRPRSPNLDD